MSLIRKEFIKNCSLGYFSCDLKEIDLDTYEKGFNQACEKGHLKIVKLLLTLNSKINISNNDEYPFRWSCYNGHLDVCKYLIEINPDINIHILDEWAFRFSCHMYCINKFKGDGLEVAKWLFINFDNIDLNIYNNAVYTFAVANKHEYVKEWLLEIYPSFKK